MRRLLSLIILLLMVSGVAAIPVSANSVQLAAATVVNATNLNVRTAPTTQAGIIAVISRGYSYAVTGRTADNAWWQLQLQPSGAIGWAAGAYLQVINAHVVPVVSAPAPTPANAALGTVTAQLLNVRVTPDPVNGAILTQIRGGEVYSVIGRTNLEPLWWQVRLANGQTGWVNGRYLYVTNPLIPPITNTVPPAVESSGRVTAYFLNVRIAPNPYLPNVIGRLSRGQVVRVIGRNFSGTWWQIDTGDGLIGWVNGRYMSVTNAHAVPITE